MGIQGRVYVQFVIAKNGDIVGIRTRGPDKISKKAERIIGKLPKMTLVNKEVAPFEYPLVFQLPSVYNNICLVYTGFFIESLSKVLRCSIFVDELNNDKDNDFIQDF